MKRMAPSVLIAIFLGFAAVMTVAEPVQAKRDVEYRIISCDAIEEFPPFPLPPDYVEPDPEFLVTISTSPDDIGQLCETVLASLATQGFKIIEIRNLASISGFGVATGGIVHYLERRSGDD